MLIKRAGISARYIALLDADIPAADALDLFSELRADDELVVLARGLGLIRVITNLLHSYDAIGNNLIVLVGADDRENGWIGEGLSYKMFDAVNNLTTTSSGRACSRQQVAQGPRSEPSQHRRDECSH